MGFSLYAPLKTVYARLEAAGALDCLRDERMMIATGDIKTDGRQRPEIERDIKQKEGAVTYLARRYMNANIDEEGMRACILSIADNHTFLIQNRHCCDQMMVWLTECYHPTEPSNPWSLAILGGRAGARLTHSHANQYSYVLQSLTLWREVMHDMFGSVAHAQAAAFHTLRCVRHIGTGAASHSSVRCLFLCFLQSVGEDRGGFVRCFESLPSPQHGSRIEPSPIRSARRSRDAQYLEPLSTEARKLGRQLGHPPRRSQCTECITRTWTKHERHTHTEPTRQAKLHEPIETDRVRRSQRHLSTSSCVSPVWFLVLL
jgi:hypothetical protein